MYEYEDNYEYSMDDLSADDIAMAKFLEEEKIKRTNSETLYEDILNKYKIGYGYHIGDKVDLSDVDMYLDFPGNKKFLCFWPDAAQTGPSSVSDVTVVITYPNDLKTVTNLYNELNNISTKYLYQNLIKCTLEKLISCADYYFSENED